MERTDERVMMDYQAGSDAAICELFQRYKRRILYFCVGILDHRADAEDIAGEVFMAVIAHRERYRPPKTVSTWLYTIARNKCVDRLRRKRRFILPFSKADLAEDEAAAPPWDPPSPEEPVSDSLARRETAERVRQALARLPLEQREALILRQYHDCSYEQIAEILHCSLAKVKTLIFRAKERLRVELRPLAKEDIQ